jgi:hypothetical protein|tara:strand:- start:462 stop:743 length:282 start_codon:yes stop_codon:yes gene_type:complete
MTKDEVKKERAHKKDGKFKADDPATPDQNEAFKPIRFYLMRDELANTILQKLAKLPYGEVSEMLNGVRAMQHVLVDPTTNKVLDQAVAEPTKK